MDKLTEIRQIWRDRFSDSRQWMTEVFSRIYRDDEAFALVNDDDAVVSELLLRRQNMRYLGQDLPMGYIYGAATHRKEQSKGYMTRLMQDALRAAALRGDVLVTLLPQRRRLYDFFNRFDFGTIFFIDEQRFTAVHKFEYPRNEYHVETEVYYPEELACAYNRLSALRRGAFVTHNEADFRTLLIHNEIVGVMNAVVRNTETGNIAAIAFATANPSAINVRELVADSPAAANAALHSFTERCPGRMTILDTYPERRGIRLFARGMGRIVNVQLFLEAVARIAPTLRYTFRITDPLLDFNNGTFTVRDGKVTRLVPNAPQPKPDLEVGINVLTEIFFSTPAIGDIFSLPSTRPMISLMM